jgi:hypothetical protein
MDVLTLVALVVLGFTACGEFASYAFVHPVIRRLPRTHHITVEQGLLRTYGRVMPLLMPVSALLAVAYAVDVTGDGGGTAVTGWAAVAAVGAATVSTVAVNVPINVATGRWDAESPPPDWKEVRDRWERFQGIRSWLLLLGFVFLCFSVAFRL